MASIVLWFYNTMYDMFENNCNLLFWILTLHFTDNILEAALLPFSFATFTLWKLILFIAEMMLY